MKRNDNEKLIEMVQKVVLEEKRFACPYFKADIYDNQLLA